MGMFLRYTLAVSNLCKGRRPSTLYAVFYAIHYSRSSFDSGIGTADILASNLSCVPATMDKTIYRRGEGESNGPGGRAETSSTDCNIEPLGDHGIGSSTTVFVCVLSKTPNP